MKDEIASENGEGGDRTRSEPLVATVPGKRFPSPATVDLPGLTTRWDQIKAFLAVLGLVALLLWIVRWLAVSGKETEKKTAEDSSEPKSPKKKVA